MKKTFSILAMAALALSAQASTSVGVLAGISTPDLVSQNSPTNAWSGGVPSMTFATNNYYPPAIAGGTIVTNFVWLNNITIPPQFIGNTLDIDVMAAASGVAMLPGTFGGVTNVQFAFYTSVAPLLLTTNPGSGSYICTSNSPQPVLFTTVTLGFNSMTNTVAQTNVCFTPATTISWCGDRRLYLGTINAFVTNTAYVTNYSIYINQN